MPCMQQQSYANPSQLLAQSNLGERIEAPLLGGAKLEVNFSMGLQGQHC